MAEPIARACALADRDVQRSLRRRLPTIIGFIPPPLARHAAAEIIEAGGDAIAPTLHELAGLGSTAKIRDLDVREGRLTVECWRDDPASIAFDEIEVLVRAHLSDRTRKALQDRRRTMFESASPGAVSSYLLAGGLGASLAITGGGLEGWGERPEVRLTTSDKLDLHLRDGRIFQIDGDKFGYEALGALRGYSDRSNMDAMFELLQHLAPHAIADAYFGLWSAPVQHAQMPVGIGERTDFAFYSRWVALIYRYFTHASG